MERIECYSHPAITKEDIEFGKRFENKPKEEPKPQPKPEPKPEDIRFY